MEEWKQIDGYPNYAVSTEGRVMNVVTERILKPTPMGSHWIVGLRRNNRQKVHYLHRVVAEAFFDEPIEGLKVRFVDGDKSNAALSNLELDVRKTVKRGRSGNRVKILETHETFDSIWACANHIGGDPSGIYAVLNGRSWTYKGYHYRYVK